MSAPVLPFGQEQPKGIQFGIDWLAFTVKGISATPVELLIRQVLGDEWKHWETISQRDRRRRSKGPFGTLMEVDWVEKWVHVQMKGQGCRAIGTEQVMALVEALLQRFGDAFQVKRVDLAWDDFNKRFRPSDVRDRFWSREAGAKRPEVVCKAKRGHFRQDDSPEGGESYTIGERTSKRMLRVYDKAAQSGGKVDAVRWELECKDQVAHRAVEAMMRTHYSSAALRFLVGFLDFREVEPGRPSKERKRCAWFESVVGDARRCPLGALERIDLEEWVENYLKQQSSGFRVLLRVLGGDIKLAAEVLLAGNPKDNPRHRGWHARLRSEGAADLAARIRHGSGRGEALPFLLTPLN